MYENTNVNKLSYTSDMYNNFKIDRMIGKFISGLWGSNTFG